jgi:hypothetical protein
VADAFVELLETHYVIDKVSRAYSWTDLPGLRPGPRLPST